MGLGTGIEQHDAVLKLAGKKLRAFLEQFHVIQPQRPRGTSKGKTQTHRGGLPCLDTQEILAPLPAHRNHTGRCIEGLI